MPDTTHPAATDASGSNPAKPPWRSIWSHFSGVAARNRAAAGLTWGRAADGARPFDDAGPTS